MRYKEKCTPKRNIQWVLLNWGQLSVCGKSWRMKTKQQHSQNVLHLFETPCHLIGPVALTWRTCEYYVISELLT